MYICERNQLVTGITSKPQSYRSAAVFEFPWRNLLSSVFSGEQQPSVSHDSDTSLIMPVELVLSDMDLQSEPEPEHEDVKSCEGAVGADGLSMPLREQVCSGPKTNNKSMRRQYQHRVCTDIF